MNLLIGLSDGRRHPIVLLIEDAEEVLLPRAADNSAGVAKLLNLADGMLGTALDIRILATTNANALSIDDALKRAGRLCRMQEIAPLSTAKANALYQNLTNKDNTPFTEPTKLADVYAKKYNTSTQTENTKTIGFAARMAS